jgi:hypothetical protein
MSTKIVVNGNSGNSLLFTNVRTTDIRVSDAETDWDRKNREAKESLLAEIKRRTEENTYKV